MIFIIAKAKQEKNKEQAFSTISARSFIVIVVMLLAILFFCGSLSYFVPQGSFLRDADNNIIPDTYQKGEIQGISFLRVISAPVRVFASDDAIKQFSHIALR